MEAAWTWRTARPRRCRYRIEGQWMRLGPPPRRRVCMPLHPLAFVDDDLLWAATFFARLFCIVCCPLCVGRPRHVASTPRRRAECWVLPPDTAARRTRPRPCRAWCGCVPRYDRALLGRPGLSCVGRGRRWEAATSCPLSQWCFCLRRVIRLMSRAVGIWGEVWEGILARDRT